ncbi:hypothetical protein ACMXYV_12500 [Neptuniibacter sp. SY11_33]|uniref:hypothetical protein n=1 Tax=Neptuniibacter sp. SY11_33 TaxID=3398215 RepID=UPI0039F56DA0
MFKRSALSVSIASVLLSTSLVATANTQNEEDQDSVNSWGSWAKQYATAAGGELNNDALAFANLGQGETGRNALNEPEINNVEGVCEAGSFCGFTQFSDNGYMMMYGNDEVGVFDLDASPDYFIDGGEGSAIAGSFSVEGNDGFSAQVAGLQGTAYDYLSGMSGDGGSVGYHRFGFMMAQSDLMFGHWNVYGSQPEQKGSPMFMYGTHGFFVGGVTTTLDQLNDFVSNLNGSIAQYSGHTFDGGSFNIAINFDSNTWSGAFGSGYHNKKSDAFAVNGGQVSGINFSAGASSLSSGSGRVSGLVNGAIFGEEAGDVAGMIDIEISGEESIIRKAVFASSVGGPA